VHSGVHEFQANSRGRCSPLQKLLHTWYVGALTRLATKSGFTERRVPPTCRRLPRDFALFPVAIGLRPADSSSLTKKREVARRRPTVLADDTLGGRVQKMSDWTDDFKTTSQILRGAETDRRDTACGLSEKAPRGINSGPLNRPPRIAESQNTASQIAPVRSVAASSHYTAHSRQGRYALLTAGGASGVRATHDRHAQRSNIISQTINDYVLHQRLRATACRKAQPK
jgi:hypothetical protein